MKSATSMTCDEVVAKLKTLGSQSIKNVLVKHGAVEPFYGVKIEELKKIQKVVKVDHALALQLYDTGISDAMYLAGLIADPMSMSKKDLQHWMSKAPWHMISEYTVPWVASESKFGTEIGMKWIDAKDAQTQAAGWATLASVAAITPDEELDITLYDKLLDRVQRDIHSSENRVRQVMNGFVIGVGSTVKDLTKKAIAVGKAIGKVTVNMNGTACTTPSIVEYIKKVEDKGKLGKKRKSARC